MAVYGLFNTVYIGTLCYEEGYVKTIHNSRRDIVNRACK